MDVAGAQFFRHGHERDEEYSDNGAGEVCCRCKLVQPVEPSEL